MAKALAKLPLFEHPLPWAWAETPTQDDVATFVRDGDGDTFSEARPVLNSYAAQFEPEADLEVGRLVAEVAQQLAQRWAEGAAALVWRPTVTCGRPKYLSILLEALNREIAPVRVSWPNYADGRMLDARIWMTS